PTADWRNSPRVGSGRIVPLLGRASLEGTGHAGLGCGHRLNGGSCPQADPHWQGSSDPVCVSIFQCPWRAGCLRVDRTLSRPDLGGTAHYGSANLSRGVPRSGRARPTDILRLLPRDGRAIGHCIIADRTSALEKPVPPTSLIARSPILSPQGDEPVLPEELPSLGVEGSDQ